MNGGLETDERLPESCFLRCGNRDESCRTTAARNYSTCMQRSHDISEGPGRAGGVFFLIVEIIVLIVIIIISVITTAAPAVAVLVVVIVERPTLGRAARRQRDCGDRGSAVRTQTGIGRRRQSLGGGIDGNYRGHVSPMCWATPAP